MPPRSKRRKPPRAQTRRPPRKKRDAESKSYWDVTHRPLQCLAFVLPLVLAYEIGMAVLHGRATDQQLAAQVILHWLFSLFGAGGAYLPGIVLVIVLVVWQVSSHYPWKVALQPLAGMAGESILLAVPLFFFHQWLPGLMATPARMQNAEFRMQNAECRTQNSKFNIQNAACRPDGESTLNFELCIFHSPARCHADALQPILPGEGIFGQPADWSVKKTSPASACRPNGSPILNSTFFILHSPASTPPRAHIQHSAFSIQHSPPTLLAAGRTSHAPWDDLLLSIGAGLYEELLFRLIGISLLTFLLIDTLGMKQAAGVALAVILSSLLFGLHHYAPIGNDTWDTAKFAFRTAAGAYLACVFVVRGFGVAVGCHAMYDIIATLSGWAAGA